MYDNNLTLLNEVKNKFFKSKSTQGIFDIAPNILEFKDMSNANLTYCDFLCDFYDELFKNIIEPKTKSDRNLNGKLFEFCILYSLVKYGVPIDHIKYSVRSIKHSLEFDIIIDDAVDKVLALHLKASMRERWSQADRSSILFNNAYSVNEKKLACEEMGINPQINNIPSYLLCVRERRTNDKASDINYTISRVNNSVKSYALNGAICIYDKNEVNKLFKQEITKFIKSTS